MSINSKIPVERSISYPRSAFEDTLVNMNKILVFIAFAGVVTAQYGGGRSGSAVGGATSYSSLNRAFTQRGYSSNAGAGYSSSTSSAYATRGAQNSGGTYTGYRGSNQAAGGYAAAGGNGYGNDDQSLSEPARYEFRYDVFVPEETLEFGHQEQRDGDDTTGSYYVLLPDGRRQLVEYTADQNGYRPRISYTDVATNSGEAAGYGNGAGSRAGYGYGNEAGSYNIGGGARGNGGYGNDASTRGGYYSGNMGAGSYARGNRGNSFDRSSGAQIYQSRSSNGYTK